MNLKAVLLAAVALVGTTTAAFGQGFGPSRQSASDAADRLLVEVEELDEVLHDTQGAEHLVELVHHFQETVAEFEQLVLTAPLDEIDEEMEHIREDLRLIGRTFGESPRLHRNPRVMHEWHTMMMAYGHLDQLVRRMLLGRF